ncbi:MAG: PQQ-like beta-propeller repeat protein, partial [Opitutaceae bacterium]|nr:PQQ-like beta-propeller repeat protein [Opitutaceae bacterium]
DGLTTRVFAVGVPHASHAEATPPAARPAPRPDVRELWRFAAGAKISASPALHDGGLFFGSWDQQIYALDAANGRLRWRHATGNAVTTTPACHATTAYAASRDGHLYALHTGSGQLQWKSLVSEGRMAVSPNGSWVDASPAIGAYTCGPQKDSPAPVRLFVGCHNRDLHAFDIDRSRDASWFAPASAGEGTEVWRFPTFNWILTRPAVAGYRVFFGSVDGRLYAVDARCGALLWSYTAGRHLRYSPHVVPGSVACEAVCGAPLVVDDTVYFGADDGYLYALDASTGAEKWVFQTEKWIWGRPLWQANVLVVASADGRVYGLDAASGKRLWVHATGNANYADVVALGSLALVACTSGRLHALDSATGEQAWTFDADAGLRAAPAVDPQGVVYLPTCAGTLYALQGRHA